MQRLARPDVSLSVVVPARNREKLIGPCLHNLIVSARSIEAGQVGPVEVLVVDDDSDDDTSAVARRMAAEARDTVPITVIRLSPRQGPAGARNAGVSEAKGSIIVFVDSDVLVVPAFLSAHVHAHRRAGRLALVRGPVRLVRSVDEARSAPAGSLWDLSTNPLDTANASVRKEHLVRAGGFDPAFRGLGWEDIDLGLRLLRLGLHRVLAPEAVGYHVKPPVHTLDQLAGLLQRERERAETARYFMTKHPGFSGRMTVQYSSFHTALNWLMRLGGVVHAGNVLDWIRWADARGLRGLGLTWLSAVLTHEYLTHLHAARSQTERGSPA